MIKILIMSARHSKHAENKTDQRNSKLNNILIGRTLLCVQADITDMCIMKCNRMLTYPESEVQQEPLYGKRDES
jgi:hypothetical protein